jgi:hypothetical protein
MSNSGAYVKEDAIREIAGTALTTSYQVWGGVLLRDSYLQWITNNTNGDIYVSTDGVTNMRKMPATSGRAYDNKTNDLFVRAGTQFYIKYAVAPGTPSGWVALEVIYA